MANFAVDGFGRTGHTEAALRRSTSLHALTQIAMTSL